ncbi:unnamed protein product [Closterium sp. NIES-53]
MGMEAKDALDSPGGDSNGFVDLGSILGGDRWTYVNDDLTASTGSNSSASGAIPGGASPSHEFLHTTGGDSHVTNPHSGNNAQNPVSSTTGNPTSGSSGGGVSSSSSSSSRWDGGLFRMDGRSSVFSAAPWRGVAESATDVGSRRLSQSVSFAFDAAAAGTGMASALPGSSHGRAGAWNVYNRLGRSVADGMDFPGQIGTARAGSPGRINEVDTLLNGGAGYSGAVGAAGVVTGSSSSTGVGGSRGGGGVGSGARCVSPWCSSVRDSLLFLLPTEQVVLEEPNTLLVNTDTTGHLLLTSLRILFLSASPSPAVHPSATIPASSPCALAPHPLGSVYFPVIDRVAKLPPGRLANSRDHLLQVHTKDARVLVYALPPRVCAQAPPVFDTIIHLLPRSLLELPVFHAPLAALATPTATTTSTSSSRSGSSSNSSSAGSIEEGALSPTTQASLGAGAATPPRACTPPLPPPPAAAAATAGASVQAVGVRAGQETAGVVMAECMRVLAMLPEHWRRLWQISRVNVSYAACSSYPQRMLLPSSISDEDAMASASFRARGRFPVMCWQHPGNGAVLSRAAQPLVGILSNNRSDADERLVAALAGPALPGESFRRLVVADARPRKNAIANGAMGGGYESSANYRGTEVVYLGIDNIHAVRDSMNRLREYLDTHGSACSDGSSSLLRSGTGGWTGGSVSGTSQVVAALVDSCWLQHCHSLLSGAVFIAAQIALQGNSVLVHCSDGWDRTPSLVSLAMLLLDPYYRTFQGFQSLVETHWAAFGHPFADRLGVPADPPTVSSSSSRTNPALSLAAAAAASPGAIAGGVGVGCGAAGCGAPGHGVNSSAGAVAAAAAASAAAASAAPAGGAAATAAGAAGTAGYAGASLSSLSASGFPVASSSVAGSTFQANSSNNQSPVFFQWIDAVAQLLRLFPRAFEFSTAFLVDLLDSVLSCSFANFLCNNDKERTLARTYHSSSRPHPFPHSHATLSPASLPSSCVWEHLRRLRDPSSPSSSLSSSSAAAGDAGRGRQMGASGDATAAPCCLLSHPHVNPLYSPSSIFAASAPPASAAFPAAPAATAAVCTATSSTGITSSSISTSTQAAIRPTSCPPVQIRHMTLFPPSPPSPAILLPPAASLAPVLLPELYLRWCCPAAVPPLRSLVSSSSPLASPPPSAAAAAAAAATGGGGPSRIESVSGSEHMASSLLLDGRGAGGAAAVAAATVSLLSSSCHAAVLHSSANHHRQEQHNHQYTSTHQHHQHHQHHHHQHQHHQQKQQQQQQHERMEGWVARGEPVHWDSVSAEIRRLYHSHQLIEAPWSIYPLLPFVSSLSLSPASFLPALLLHPDALQECAALQGAVEQSQLGMQQLQQALQESESRRAEAERRRDGVEGENAALRRNLANLQQSQEAMLAAVCQEAASAAAAAAFTAAGAGGSAVSASADAAVRSRMAASSRFPSLASAATAAAAAAAAAAAGGLRLALPTGARRSPSVSSEPRSSGAAPDASGASGAAAPDSVEASHAVGLGEALRLDTGRSNGAGGGAVSPAHTTPPFLPLHAASWSPCFGSGGAVPTCPSCARPLMVVAAEENELEEGGAGRKAGGRIGGVRGEGVEESSAVAREDGEWEEAIEGWQYECLWCGLSASGCRKTSGSWTAAAEVDNGEVGESRVKDLKKLLEQQGQQQHHRQFTVSEAADGKPYAGGNRGNRSGTAGSASNCHGAVCSMPVPAFVRADFDALRCGPIPNYVGSLSSSSSHSAGAAAM